MSQRHDPDLESIFDKEPRLERYARLLRAARLKPPPLDPGFRHGLRRQLMTQAYDRYQRRTRPGFLATLFSGPRMAAATVLIGAVLVAFLLLANANLFGSGRVTVTTEGSVAVDQPILVSFSQPMDHQSVEQAIQIQPATQVTYSWQGNNLVIQPASGTLAPNTQYHVTVTAAAKTAPGTPIGQPAVVAVNTAPLPSPSPTPAPSPTPTPQPQITAEHSLGVGGQLIGFNADATRVIYLTAKGDLDTIAVDGSDPKTIQAGVKNASVAPGDLAIAYSTLGDKGSLYLAGPDGSKPQALGPAAGIAGWLNGKPFIFDASGAEPVGAPPVRFPISDAVGAYLSPDGTRLVVIRAAAGNPFLFTLASGAATDLHGQGFAWSPDSSHLAYWRDGSVDVSAPDGGGVVAVAKVASAVQPRWTEDGHKLLFGSADGAWIVGSDGNDLHQLSQSAFETPLWAPGDTRFGFLRDGSLWVDQVSTAGGTSLDLGAAAAIVDAYEKARIAGDGGTASGLLGPSASPVAPSPVPTAEHLARYFVISSQATAIDARFTARLIFDQGKNEVRYQDEQLVVVNTAAGLKIESVTDSLPQPLGKGPTVNSAAASFNRLVLVFDSDLDPASVAGSTTMLGSDGQPVALTTSYDHRKVTVEAKLDAGKSYQLAISSALKDIAGQSLRGGYTYTFVATAAPSAP